MSINGSDNESQRKTEAEHVIQRSISAETVAAASSGFFTGKVEFDLGEISFPGHGDVRIKGEYLQINSRHKRIQLDDSELHIMKTNLRAWAEIFFEMETEPIYFDEVIITGCYSAAFFNPFHAIDSPEMGFCSKFMFWIFVLDEIVEMALVKQNPFEDFKLGLEHFMQVLRGNRFRIQISENLKFPNFKALFDSLVDIDRDLEKHIVGYRKKVEPYCFQLERFFEAYEWYATAGKIDFRYSEATFLNWHRIIIFVEQWISSVLLVLDVQFPVDLYLTPAVRRYVEIVNSQVAIVNDIIGVKNELRSGAPDNFLLFKIYEKGIPVEESVEQLLQMYDSDLQELFLLRQGLLKQFPNNPSILAFLDVCEAALDGNNRFHCHCPRYSAIGMVKLTNLN